MVGLMKENKI